MTFKRVPPGNAVQWVSGAIGLLLANPVPFLLMGLAMTAIAMLPLLGALVLLIVGPVFYAGISSAARAQHTGTAADFNQLLSGFQIPGKAGQLIALCLPGVGLMFAFIVLGVMIVISAGAMAVSGGQNIQPTMDLVTLFGAGGLITLVLLMLPLALAAAALLFFAVPRVMFDGIEPFAAMRESAQAVLANFGAFALTVLTLFVARFVVSVVLATISPMLAVLVAGVVFTPLLSAVLYVAWADVFGGISEPEESVSEGAQTPTVGPPSIEA
jgi:hypothetical protein